MEKGQLWTVVSVALIVAVVASLVTASITGNVIRLNQDRLGKYKVYTVDEVYSKEEIDNMYTALKQNKVDREEFEAKITAFATYKGVLDLLNRNCEIWSVEKPNITREVSGNDICEERDAGTCILTINYDRLSSNDMIQRCSPYVKGKSDTTLAYCCKI